MDYTLKTIGAMHLDGDLQDHSKVMKAKGDHLKAWMQSKTNEGRQHHLKQYQALDNHFSGKNPYKPERMELSEDDSNPYIKGAHPLLLEGLKNKTLNKSESLVKDQGRITFPKIESKFTRPDQEVSSYDTEKQKITRAKLAENKFKQYFPDDNSSEFKDHLLNEMSGMESTPSKKTSEVITPTAHIGEAGVKANIGAAIQHKNADPQVREHEGLHWLVNHISDKNQVPAANVYNYLNKRINPGILGILKSGLNHFGYESNTHHMEMVPLIRDILTDSKTRDALLDKIPKEQHQSFLNKVKTSYIAIKEAAKNASLDDMKKSDDKKYSFSGPKRELKGSSKYAEEELKMCTSSLKKAIKLMSKE